MNQSLADLIAAHKFLCEAVAGQGVGSGAPRQVSPDHAAPLPQSPAHSHYLTEEEESRVEEQLGLKPEPLLEKIQAQQFQELFTKRQELREMPDAPQFITPEKRASARIPNYEHLRPGPVPVPNVVEEVPLEIRQRDQIQQERWNKPEEYRPARPVESANLVSGIAKDFNEFQSQQG
jgi:hypothetical protein